MCGYPRCLGPFLLGAVNEMDDAKKKVSLGAAKEIEDDTKKV